MNENMREKKKEKCIKNRITYFRRFSKKFTGKECIFPLESNKKKLICLNFYSFSTIHWISFDQNQMKFAGNNYVRFIKLPERKNLLKQAKLQILFNVKVCSM